MATLIYVFSGVYAAATDPPDPRPPNARQPPKLGETTIKPTPKVLEGSWGVENDKSPGRWERKLVNNHFPLKFSNVKLKNFLGNFKS